MIYIVQPGETLNGIAIKFLGSATPAATLFQINKRRIKSGSPERLAAGEQLVIPEQMIASAKASRRAPNGSTDVVLVVNGLEYGGWESVQVTRSMETASASFTVGLTDRWQPDGEPWPIFAFDEVRVYVGADLLITGYVDEVGLSLDDSSHSMTVSGRDRTADLIDCSAMNRPGVFKGKKLEEIARILAQPFGVEVLTDQDTGSAIAVFALLPGEKVHEAISRAAIAKNLLVTAGPNGGLLITRSGAKRSTDAIIEGANLLSGNSRVSATERFSDYIVEGQAGGQGKNSMRGTYRDPGVPRYRPLMIHAEQKATSESVKARAEWEARARAARASSGSVILAGWRQSDGHLWEINRIVPTRSPSLGLDDDLLIGDVTYDLSPSAGQTVSMSLYRPDAFTSADELQAEKDAVKVKRLSQRGKGKGQGVSKADIAKALADAGVK